MRGMHVATAKVPSHPDKEAEKRGPALPTPHDVVIDVIVAYTRKSRNLHRRTRELVELAIEESNTLKRSSNRKTMYCSRDCATSCVLYRRAGLAGLLDTLQHACFDSAATQFDAWATPAPLCSREFAQAFERL